MATRMKVAPDSKKPACSGLTYMQFNTVVHLFWFVDGPGEQRRTREVLRAFTCSKSVHMDSRYLQALALARFGFVLNSSRPTNILKVFYTTYTHWAREHTIFARYSFQCRASCCRSTCPRLRFLPCRRLRLQSRPSQGSLLKSSSWSQNHQTSLISSRFDS